MASQSSGDVEILVHLTAPSKASDDVTYRRLAQAYLSYAPGSRAHVTIPSSPEPQQPPPSRQGHYDDGLAVLQSFCSDSQDMSFRDALDNRNSPPVVARKARLVTPPPHVLPENSTMPTTAVRQLPSQIADSYPMPDCDMFNVTPTRVLQRYMGNRQPPALTPMAPAPAPSSSPALSSRGDYGEAKGIKTEAHALDIPESSSLPAQEPGRTEEGRSRRQATIPVTPLVSEASRKRKAIDNEHVHDTPGPDITHVSISTPSSSNSSTVILHRAETYPLPSKRFRQLAQDSAAVHLVRRAGDNADQQHPAQHTPPFSSPQSYNVLSHMPSMYPSASSSSSSVAVRPPSPPVGIDHLDHASLVSAKLAKLAHDLSSRYRPTMHRPVALDPLERGHWRVDCRGWPPAQRVDAWAFLAGYIRSGLAGWGVWCRRSADGQEIKLYGWAHVVKHTYLLLYLASGRHIKATGAKWFDAEGVVAVEVVP